MSIRAVSFNKLGLAAFGTVVALLSGAQALRSVDVGSLDVRTVSDPVVLSSVANVVPTVRLTAHTCRGLEAGSGFVLKGGIVITAGHVVDGATSVTVDVEGLGAQPGTVIGVDGAGRDIAVVFVPALAGVQGAEISSNLLVRGADIAATGHPRGGVRQSLAGTVVGYVDSGPLAADGGRVLTVSVGFEPGMSGGPVVDVHGRVVGVIIGVERNSGTGIAIPTSEITRTLHGDGLTAMPACGTTR